MSRRSLSRLSCLVLLVIAFALRVHALESKGLSYDEAATALMARATPAKIITFHWRAAFEHPPIWQLLMHGWSQLVGQSEFALRYLPVLAGVLLLPLLYQLARQSFTIHPLPFTLHHSSLILTTFAPILIYYSQEARMYALVVTVAVAAVLALTSALTAKRPTRWWIATIFLHWFMLGLHYYSILIVIAEGLFCLLWLFNTRAKRRSWRTIVGALAAAITPLALWLALAPGFHDTLRITLADSTPKPDTLKFLSDFWRELSFAAVRWDVPTSVWGYLWLPMIGLGVAAALIHLFQASAASVRGMLPSSLAGRGWGWGGLLPLLALLPIALSALAFPSLATRYLLYVVPFLLLLMAAGISWLGRFHWSLGTLGLLTALVVPALALPHYYGNYQKSEYRAMADYLTTHRAADEAVLLEAPRQHLLAKYYLPAETPVYTAPAIDLPLYWPVNAPPVVPEEMDDVIQDLLREYRGLWLSLTAENEVDPGEFVPKYLTAVAYEVDCTGWLDVRLCHYHSPHATTLDLATRIDVRFGADLTLTNADLVLTDLAEGPMLLATLHWQATAQPQADYRVTLRLVDPATDTVLSQRDSYPIGPLLPPTTWNVGDEKPGYLALPLPTNLPTGTYHVVANLYDPATGATISHVPTAAQTSSAQAATTTAQSTTDPVVLAILTVNDTMSLE